MPTPTRQYYQSLVESLRLIAAEASVQKSSVEEGSAVTEEITGIFAINYPMVELLASKGLIGREALKALASIHEWVWLRVEAEADLPESLSHHPHWENGRCLAARALGLMGERVQPPDHTAFLHIDIDMADEDEMKEML